jgi:hypothetical protein
MCASHSPALLVVLLCSLLAGAANAEPSPDPTHKECHPGDKSALLAIKAALGESYHFASWTPDNPCCDWYDVTCDLFTGRVVGLAVFQDANLTGTIPSALAGLPHLQNLVLHHLPTLSGPIPPAVAKLSNLSSLTISCRSGRRRLNLPRKLAGNTTPTSPPLVPRRCGPL